MLEIPPEALDVIATACNIDVIGNILLTAWGPALAALVAV